MNNINKQIQNDFLTKENKKYKDFLKNTQETNTKVSQDLSSKINTMNQENEFLKNQINTFHFGQTQQFSGQTNFSQTQPLSNHFSLHQAQPITTQFNFKPTKPLSTQFNLNQTQPITSQFSFLQTKPFSTQFNSNHTQLNPTQFNFQQTETNDLKKRSLQRDRIEIIKSQIISETQIQDPVIGLYKKPGVNYGRPLSLGKRNGIYFMNGNNNPSYVPKKERLSTIEWLC